MILAQADLSALPAGWLKYMIIFLVASAVATAVVVGAVVSVLQYFQSKRAASEPQIRQISPQPLTVEVVEALHDRFASKASFDAHVQENKNDMARISRERGEDLRASAGSRKTMYDKQDELRKELTARIDGVNRDLTTKIENIPDKVISTLRNAGAIGGKL